MHTYTLSYIITTRNKLALLKCVLEDLFLNKTNDEEIIIVDANSTDGTKEYLKKLLDSNNINYFISESDKGEAHGWNKAILLANGEIIKVITDDDLYYYPTIKKCKEYMLNNKHVEVMSFDGFYVDAQLPALNIRPVFFTKDYLAWVQSKKPFIFCGITLMFRKDAIAHLGLFHCDFKAVDYEYTLRITSQKINFAWHSGFAYVNIKNDKSNSELFTQIILNEKQKLLDFYTNNKDTNFIKTVIQKLKNRLSFKTNTKQFDVFYFSDKINLNDVNLNIDSNYYKLAYKYMHAFNKKNNGEIIYNNISENYLGKNFYLNYPEI